MNELVTQQQVTGPTISEDTQALIVESVSEHLSRVGMQRRGWKRGSMVEG